MRLIEYRERIFDFKRRPVNLKYLIINGVQGLGSASGITADHRRR